MLPPIEKPTAILNEAVARRNIARMAAKVRRSGIRFRPHFKTHQSAAIGEWFREEGVSAITVSSVEMARYFAAHGWRDILIAFPVNWLEIAHLNRLAAEIELGLLVESVETARFLGERLTAPASVWLKIDTGYGRTGLRWDDAEGQIAVARALSSGRTILRGLLTHAGHSYAARSQEAVGAVYAETLSRLSAARDRLGEAGFPALQLSLGDTPACSVVDDFGNVDELRPGNFVFYDLMQIQAGACSYDDIAVAVACPVVAVHPREHKIVLYGGAVHLSKDRLTRADGAALYGEVALPADGGWGAPVPGSYVSGVSQEHGIVCASDALLEQVHTGDVLFVLPVHSCLTVDVLRQYRTLTGEVIPMMPRP